MAVKIPKRSQVFSVRLRVDEVETILRAAAAAKERPAVYARRVLLLSAMRRLKSDVAA